MVREYLAVFSLSLAVLNYEQKLKCSWKNITYSYLVVKNDNKSGQNS